MDRIVRIFDENGNVAILNEHPDYPVHPVNFLSGDESR
jgi:hypothetical protein